MGDVFQSGHDYKFHLPWAYYFSEQFISGDFFVKYLTESNCGFGSNTFVYYPPIPFYVVAVLRVLTLNKVDVINLLNFSVILISCIGSYGVFLLANGFLKRKTALVCALGFIVIPYHLAIDYYYRFSYAELYAFGILPFLFIVYRKNVSQFLVICLAVTFMFLSHLPSALICIPISFLYHLFIESRREKSKERYIHIISAFVIGFLLSSFYVLPANFIENPNMSIMWETNYYEDSFMSYFIQVVKEKLEDIPFFEFDIVIFSVVLALFVIGLLSFFLIKNRVKEKKDYLIAFFLITLISFYMFSSFSKWIYHLFPVYQKIQFPWRWSILASLSTIILLGFVWEKIKNTRVFILLFFFGSLAFAFLVNHLHSYHTISMSQIHEQYEPSEYHFYSDKIRFEEDSRVKSNLGNTDIKIKEWKARRIALFGDFKQGEKIQLKRNHFGSWVDRFNSSDYRIYKNEDGIIELLIGKANIKTVNIEMEFDPAEKIGLGISIIGLVLLFGLFVFQKRYDCDYIFMHFR